MLVTLEGYENNYEDDFIGDDLDIQDVYLDENLGFSFKKKFKKAKRRVKKVTRKVSKAARLRAIARAAKIKKLKKLAKLKKLKKAKALAKKAALLKQQKALLKKAKKVGKKVVSKKNILKVAQISTAIGRQGGHVVGGVVGVFYPKAGKAITKLADSASDMSMMTTQMILNKGVQEGGEIVPQDVMEDVIGEAKDYVESPEIASQIYELAAEKTGIDLNQPMSMAQANMLKQTKDQLQIDAVKKLMPQILKRKSQEGLLMKQPVASPYQVPVEKPEPEKFTIEQIEAFNRQQKYSKGGVLDFSTTDSPGDIYYKEGKLQGETDDQILKVLATKIYSQNPYSQVSLTSWEYVQKILKAYVYSVTKLSEEKQKSYFYNGTTESERQEVFGNLYVKICYLYLKGFTTEAQAKQASVDYQLRDQIWIVLALLKKFAVADTSGEFKRIWKPYDFKPKFSTGSINPLMIAGAGALIFLAMGKKR